jgi:hypothetical protein
MPEARLSLIRLIGVQSSLQELAGKKWNAAPRMWIKVIFQRNP